MSPLFNKLIPQSLLVVDSDGNAVEMADARLNFDQFKPGRYLIEYKRIDDTTPAPGIAKFTINRNDGTQENLYGTLGRDYPPGDPDE